MNVWIRIWTLDKSSINITKYKSNQATNLVISSNLIVWFGTVRQSVLRTSAILLRFCEKEQHRKFSFLSKSSILQSVPLDSFVYTVEICFSSFYYFPTLFYLSLPQILHWFSHPGPDQVISYTTLRSLINTFRSFLCDKWKRLQSAGCFLGNKWKKIANPGRLFKPTCLLETWELYWTCNNLFQFDSSASSRNF